VLVLSAWPLNLLNVILSYLFFLSFPFLSFPSLFHFISSGNIYPRKASIVHTLEELSMLKP
jgi:hypothetical protein